MGLSYSQRTVEGFKWEDRIARKLRRKGHDVTVMARNNRYDLLVNESIRVDVKAAALTSYKGSDGYPITAWVFSNLSVPPTCEFYILVCLSEDRSKLIKTYIVPSQNAIQKTVSITKRDKYRAYLEAWGYFDHMKKAHMQPIGFEGREEDARESELKPLIGAALGATVGFAAVRYSEHGRLYVENQDISFKEVIGAAIGATFGRTILRGKR